ncbi:hypothetical protein DPMN_034176 [Dreissena polymorpha]|uniref:Uncharacterized protein n=1 Tax=Dreissena polymorpha TaxID=45954 RepID=A0A9D4M4Z9_DREPO|nr:hypothetical protein DPMN_034176 [Dreissena polymorpha]
MAVVVIVVVVAVVVLVAVVVVVVVVETVVVAVVVVVVVVVVDTMHYKNAVRLTFGPCVLELSSDNHLVDGPTDRQTDRPT